MEVRLCTASEVPQERAKLVRAEGRTIAVFRVGDDVFAVDNVCPHWGGPLGEGTVSVERMEITCPWHRFRYCLKTGRNVVSDIRGAATVYPVELRDGEIFATIE